MSHLILFVRSLAPAPDIEDELLDEAYLAQAVDSADLERRIHEIEYRAPNEGYFQTQAPAYGYESRGGSLW